MIRRRLRCNVKKVFCDVKKLLKYDSRPVILLTLHLRAFRCAILRDKKRQETFDISNNNATISLQLFYVQTIVLYLYNRSRSRGFLDFVSASSTGQKFAKISISSFEQASEA